jgi:glycerol kinase
MDARILLVVDQGTTSTRAVIFDTAGTPQAFHSVDLSQIYPANGWVEHDPDEIWRATLVCCREVLRGIDVAIIAGLGITNQRETALVWNRRTGKAIHNAIVWQDRRTAERCRALHSAGLGSEISGRTGLLLDPYFSATKLEWLLENVPGARTLADKGELAFGTVDSWLLWNLTGGKVHATDVTNASRTMLLNLKSLAWDQDLLTLFNIPRAMLPQVRDSAGLFGWTAPELFGAAIPILGVAGDQQAAAFGQACFEPGDVKSTYGTGCFALVQTGPVPPVSQNRLLATCASRINGHPQYAIEGSIFVAGAVVQWLRDGLGIIGQSAEIEALAEQARESDGLYFVPAFTGLGAPYWDPEARGAILGLTRDVGAAEIARSALDAVCFETRDLLEAMAKDMASAKIGPPKALKVDGGMVCNDWFCQRLADLTGLPVERPEITETTAMGAAYLTGLAAGIFRDTADIASRWKLDRRFLPNLPEARRDFLYQGWKAAITRVRRS